MKAIFRLIFIVSLIIMNFQSHAQEQLRIKEDRQGRLEHEFEMFKNPKTGIIPSGIRQKELGFVKSQSSNLDARYRSNSRFKESTQVWDQRGPFNQGGRTKAIGIDPRNESIILAGGTSGGLYRTTNGGTSWSLVSDPLSNPSIIGLAQDPTAQDTWYYITGEVRESINTNQSFQKFVGNGVFKSTDNGLNWSQLANTTPEDTVVLGQGLRSDWQLCNDIAIDPIDGAVLVSNIGGIYRSSDGGTNWTLVLDAESDVNFGDVVHLDVAKIDASTRVYYAGTSSTGTNKGFFQSDDGISWSNIGYPADWAGSWERIRVSIAQSNTDVVWFLVHGDGLYDNTDPSDPIETTDWLVKYDNNAGTWSDFTSKIPSLGGNVGDFDTQSAYNMVIRVKPDDENTIFIGDTKLWRTTDAFATSIDASDWIGGYSPDNDISSYPNHHPDVHELVFFPSNSDKALCGHDGGLSMTTDITANNGVPAGYTNPHPVTWTLLNNGLITTQAYAISIDPTTANSAVIVAGFQDNGNFATDNISGTANWSEQPHGGDGSWNAVSSGASHWYISQQFGTVERLSDGQSFGYGVNPDTRGSSSFNTFISPFILDRNDDNILYYAAKKELWRNNSISTVNEGGSPFDGTSTGWSKLTLSGATISGNITAMETSVCRANVLYLGTSTGRIYRITNSNSSSTVTISDIYSGKGLPSGYVSSVDVDPSNADHVYVTYANYEVVSIYRSTDAGVSWTNISGNLEENEDGSGSGPAIRWIHVFKKKDDSNIYLVGASTGLYSTTTLSGSSTVWTQEGLSTIGHVPVSMVRSRKVDGYVAVGTHGKGMFSTDVVSTGDAVSPAITALSPIDEATEVALDANLTITFNESVINSLGSIYLRNATDGSIIETIDATSSNISIEGTVVTINPTNDLESSTDYFVEMDGCAFKDLGGNKSEFISDETTWNFSTAALSTPSVTLVPDEVIKNDLKVTPIARGINLTFIGENVRTAEVNVYSLEGKKATYTSKTSFKNNSVNVKAILSPGVYVVKASTEKGLYTKKFLVSE